FSPLVGFGATLYYSGKSISLDTTQQTFPALAFNIAGATYYAPLANVTISGLLGVDYNGTTYSVGKWVLHYELAAFNSCVTAQLPPGYYKVELKGGRGGNGGTSGGTGSEASAYVSNSFTLTSDTTISIFRGGDGNSGNNGASGGNAGSNGRGAGSGAASGVPSIMVVGGTVYKSEGGGGGRGGDARCYDGSYTGAGGGGGGNAGGNSNGMNAHYYYALTNNMCICGAGGGGSPSGTGGNEASGTGYGGGAAGNGSQSGGAKGGTAWRLVSDNPGGEGGSTQSWSCAGQTLYSYGGGGAGAINLRATSTFNQNGVTGGSGSTGTSTTSYARIYRFQ
ncbi:MAG: hypothetical protein FWG18_03215, partial [Alphaproteobacteria bacterium]|nr:hypothetical protein [Alphaproteobacteria bacterium]